MITCQSNPHIFLHFITAPSHGEKPRWSQLCPTVSWITHCVCFGLNGWVTKCKVNHFFRMFAVQLQRSVRGENQQSKTSSVKVRRWSQFIRNKEQRLISELNILFWHSAVTAWRHTAVETHTTTYTTDCIVYKSWMQFPGLKAKQMWGWLKPAFYLTVHGGRLLLYLFFVQLTWFMTSVNTFLIILLSQ